MGYNVTYKCTNELNMLNYLVVLFCPSPSYRNFRQFTRMADYPHRSFFAKMRKKIQQITRTGR